MGDVMRSRCTPQPAPRATCPNSDQPGEQASQQHAGVTASAMVGLTLGSTGEEALNSPPVGICSSGGVPVVGREVQSRIQGSCNLRLGPCRALLLHCGPDLALHVRQGARLHRGRVHGGACGPLGDCLELGLLATAPKVLRQPAAERCSTSVVTSERDGLVKPWHVIVQATALSLRCVKVLHPTAGCGCTGQLHCLPAGLACSERPTNAHWHPDQGREANRAAKAGLWLPEGMHCDGKVDIETSLGHHC